MERAEVMPTGADLKNISNQNKLGPYKYILLLLPKTKTTEFCVSVKYDYLWLPKYKYEKHI